VKKFSALRRQRTKTQKNSYNEDVFTQLKVEELSTNKRAGLTLPPCIEKIKRNKEI